MVMILPRGRRPLPAFIDEPRDIHRLKTLRWFRTAATENALIVISPLHLIPYFTPESTIGQELWYQRFSPFHILHPPAAWWRLAAATIASEAAGRDGGGLTAQGPRMRRVPRRR
jgi:hypothetical protein